MMKEEKICIVKNFEWMKVDVIEVGFVVSLNGDFDVIYMIVGFVKDSMICLLVWVNDKDI